MFLIEKKKVSKDRIITCKTLGWAEKIGKFWKPRGRD